ncbi:MAG: cyclic nucleotide-binding domain-containing protein [Chitinivibrionales bacterium]|nr:cyclic nucleotide-binding domain-containing protein [Chitinivibrionales bacterium]MBD3396647.1 cyclic nucleotide-binding domain-containing protein [Chitinivibrionales bacterium]
MQRCAGTTAVGSCILAEGGVVDNPVWAYVFGPPKERKAMIELLKSLPAFEGLSTNELIQVDRMLHERRYTAGEMVFEEGMPGAGMYIVKEGEVAIRKKLDEGRTIQLALIQERHFFGEMALLDEMPRSASGYATRDTVLLSFCEPDLEKLTERNPRLANKILTNISRLVCKRLVRANENLEVLQSQLDGRPAVVSPPEESRVEG